jgi:hypothetical protein
MGEIDDACTQHDAMRSMTGRQIAGQSRAQDALLRYLGVSLYEARHRRRNKSQSPPDEPDTGHRIDDQCEPGSSHSPRSRSGLAPVRHPSGVR